MAGEVGDQAGEIVTHLGHAVLGTSGRTCPWVPFLRRPCSFGPDVFFRTMRNFVRHPNLNTTWLFRADILFDDSDTGANGDDDSEAGSKGAKSAEPRTIAIDGFQATRTIVRKLIPRNTRRDDPLDQTCIFYDGKGPSSLVGVDDDAGGDSKTSRQAVRSLVVYVPHETDAGKLPFYHPKVRSVAHLHEWDPVTGLGTISVHFCLFEDGGQAADGRERLERTALQLLNILHKHGQGQAAGYVKRVQHDVIVSQIRSQDRYTQLKLKYAQQLCESWAEKTNPVKHVFEDLAIAAFLIELWADMYGEGGSSAFPGFVDIGCGNGLLVYILRQEGYAGWGFDARDRKSWDNYQMAGAGPGGKALEARVLLPQLLVEAGGSTHAAEEEQRGLAASNTHDGVFDKGTFIISNHADELTPWTPILAAASDCPFISIPCCSHNLAGAKWRAPPPRKRETKNPSTYASLVDWVTRIAEDCGWHVETEMLRIPSTRNTGLLGRRKRASDGGGGEVVDLRAVIARYGGAEGYVQSTLELCKSGPRGH